MLDDDTALVIYHPIWGSWGGSGFGAVVTAKAVTVIEIPVLRLGGGQGNLTGRVSTYRKALYSAPQCRKPHPTALTKRRHPLNRSLDAGIMVMAAAGKGPGALR